jgi:transcriptional regulator with XRE-family HTH domain
MTGNRLIAYNLRALRTERGLTQDQASALLAPYVETPWSRATFSAAERSADSDRVRGFTADDLLALSLAFDVPVNYFFLPPRAADRQADELVLESAGTRVDWDDLITGPVLGRGSGREAAGRRLAEEPAAQAEAAVGPAELIGHLSLLDWKRMSDQTEQLQQTLGAVGKLLQLVGASSADVQDFLRARDRGQQTREEAQP